MSAGKILVVDDDQNILNYYVYILKKKALKFVLLMMDVER